MSNLIADPHVRPKFFDAVLCLSHLRWSFVFQRPQHLMTRFAGVVPVYYVEEPVIEGEESLPRLDIRQEGAVTVVVPRLPAGLADDAANEAQRALLDQLIAQERIRAPLLWHYTPMMSAFSNHLSPVATVYDCMDELAGFLGAPAILKRMESRLLARADVVFTGGKSLFEAKRALHANVHAFPSSVDVAHFRVSRQRPPEPDDQRDIPHPRVGFYGVIDERLDLALIGELSRLRPDWQIVLVGPVVKIDPASLPQAPNLHYLGGKRYEELPAYVAGWDVAMMPFAINAATRYISPTKTPEYLAAGRPVVSSPIVDVVREYGDAGLVAIAEDAAGFAREIDEILGRPARADWLAQVDETLAELSWDRTWQRMVAQIEQAVSGTTGAATPRPSPTARRTGPYNEGSQRDGQEQRFAAG